VRANCASGSGNFVAAQFTTQSVVGGCTTAFEPNESTAAAATITLGSTNSAAITTSTDNDYFRVVTTATSNNTFRLVGPAGVDFDMTILNSAGTQIGSGTGSTATETVTLNNQPAGTYFIRVFGYNGATSTSCYTIQATAATVTGCASSLDNSTNGTTAGAATIPFNTNVTGLISPSADIDHYRFVITTGGTITITLSTLPADYDVRLLNSAGTQVAISQAGGTTSETISYTAAAGTYFVQVYGYSGANNATSCYTLRVALGTATRPGDEVVRNDGAQKVSIYPNPAHTTLNVNTNGIAAGSLVRLYDLTGKMVATQQVKGVNTQVNVSTLKSGVYFVRLEDATGRIVYNNKFVKE
jgi:hypothetical protein